MARFEQGDRLRDPLSFQALLYAGGELDQEDAKSFELRLEEDQNARDALIRATQAVASMNNRGDMQPNPLYRKAVRTRLHLGPTKWQRLFAPRLHRGHPLMWSLTGAAAALLLLVGIERYCGNAQENSVVSAFGAFEQSLPLKTHEADQYASLAETADIWAAMHPSDHLLKAHDDEARRRTRALERARLLKGDERRSKYEPPCKPL